MTNDEVAAFYSELFHRKGKDKLAGPAKLDAQVMAVALATYVTNATLAGTTAAAYGFLVTEHGVGVATVNVGDSGDAFGVDDGTELTVLEILWATAEQSDGGILYDLDGDGEIDEWEKVLRTLANEVYSLINEQGGI